jgi:uncharacterized membrane protein YfcA
VTALALVLSALIGVSLGLLGGGGSILAVPVLVYVARVPASDAVGMSLAVVGATSLFAALLHGRRGNVDPRLAAVFAVLGAGGAYAGARLTRGLRPELLLVLFSVVMLVAGGLMLRRRPSAPPTDAPHRPVALAVVPIALCVGLLTGFLGVGGGFLVVPALVLFGRLPMKLAVGTSLVVIAANSASGFLGHVGDPGLDLAATAAFTGAAILGAAVGERLAGRLSADALRKAFGALVVLLGAAILVRNLAILM